MNLFILIDAKAPPKESYLYYDAQESYPVVEHIARNKADRLAKPNFILDVSWPRIVQFYVPKQNESLFFKPNYIHVAKEFRRRSKYAPVGFYAVSCLVHVELCSDYGITTTDSEELLPKLVGIPAGTTEGIHLNIQHNRLDVNYVSHELGIVLKEEVTVMDREENTIEQQLLQGEQPQDDEPHAGSSTTTANNNLRAGGGTTQQQQQNEQQEGNDVDSDREGALVDSSTLIDKDKNPKPQKAPSYEDMFRRHYSDSHNINNNDPNEMNDFGGNIHHSHQQQMDYADAFLSLVYTLEHFVHTTATEDADSAATAGGVEPDRALALMELIDLLHWSLPSYWNIHNLINDIRNDMGSCLTSQMDLLTIVRRHPPPHPLILKNNRVVAGWSDSCLKNTVNDGDNTNLIEAYLCGIWKLFHIITLGIHEQHGRVLGDTERTKMTHITDVVLRPFVKHFLVIACEECYDRFEFFFTSNCEVDEEQQQTTALALPPSCVSQYPSLSSSEDDNHHHDWKELALWLWAVHNQINVSVDLESKRNLGIDSTTATRMIVWPSKTQCKTCWTTVKQDQSFFENYSIHQMFHYLKQTYWPQGVSNARWVVLDKAHYQDHGLQLTYWERWIGIDGYDRDEIMEDQDDGEEGSRNKIVRGKGVITTKAQHSQQHHHHYHHRRESVLHKFVKLALFAMFGWFAITYMTNIARSSSQLRHIYYHATANKNKKKKDDDLIYFDSFHGHLQTNNNETLTTSSTTTTTATMTILNDYFDREQDCPSSNQHDQINDNNIEHYQSNIPSSGSSSNGVNHRRGF